MIEVMDTNSVREISTVAMVAALKRNFPDIRYIRTEDEDSIHLGNCAEGGTIDGLPACDYYNMDYEEKVYVMGIHKKLAKFLDKHGWFAEASDPGTYTAYRI